jgi:hypothetical protein
MLIGRFVKLDGHCRSHPQRSFPLGSNLTLRSCSQRLSAGWKLLRGTDAWSAYEVRQ